MFKGLFKSKEQLKKNEAQEFINREQQKKKEEKEIEKKKINFKKKTIEGKILYNYKQVLNRYQRNLNFSRKNSAEKKRLYTERKQNLNEKAKLEIEEKLKKFNLNLNKEKLNLNKKKEEKEQNAIALYIDNKSEKGRQSQKNYEIKKINMNQNYILNKLNTNSYDLLYRLINGLFDARLSEKSKEKFQEYLKNNPDKKEDIMKILKSVYRLKLNKSIENKKEKILKKAEKIQYNRNQFLAEIKDISSHINLATSFHNFSKKTYYICNAKQLTKNNNVKNIRDLSEKQIDELSPLYYVNGICCFNPLLRTYINKAKGLKEGLKQEILKNNSSNTGVEMVEMKPNSKKNYIDMDPIIANIEKFNDKNSILSKFFDKHILGIANIDGIQETNKKNSKSEINSKNFDRFCDEFGSFIDTIVVVENGKITFIHTKTEKSDGIKILAKYFSNKQNGGGNIQAGGFEPLTLLALLAICIPLFCSLIACYNNQDTGNTTIIKIVDYSFCVVLTTFVYMLGFIFLLGIGILSGGILLQGFGMSGSGSSKSFRVRSNYVMTDENKLKTGLTSGENNKKILS